MDTSEQTRKELADYILNRAEDSFIANLKTLVSDNEDEIVAFTGEGKSLTKEDYKQRIKSISQNIENGTKTYSPADVKDYVLNKN